MAFLEDVGKEVIDALCRIGGFAFHGVAVYAKGIHALTVSGRGFYKAFRELFGNGHKRMAQLIGVVYAMPLAARYRSQCLR